MTEFNEGERKIAAAMSLLNATVGYMLNDSFSPEEIKIFAGCAIYLKLQEMGYEEVQRMTSERTNEEYKGISESTDEYLRKNVEEYEKIKEQTLSERW